MVTSKTSKPFCAGRPTSTTGRSAPATTAQSAGLDHIFSPVNRLRLSTEPLVATITKLLTTAAVLGSLPARFTQVVAGLDSGPALTLASQLPQLGSGFQPVMTA